MNAPEKLPEETPQTVPETSSGPTVVLTSRKLDFSTETLSALSVLAKDSNADAKKRAEAIRTALKTVGKEDEEVQKAFFQAFYETLRRYNKVMRIDLQEAANLDPSQLYALSPLSRKKQAAFLLRGEIGKRYDAMTPEERYAQR